MINTSETRESRRVLLPTHASCSLSTESNMIKYGVSSNTKMRKEWLKTYQITCLRSTFSPLPPSRSVLIRDQTLSSMIYSSLFEFLFFFFFFSFFRRFVATTVHQTKSKLTWRRLQGWAALNSLLLQYLLIWGNRETFQIIWSFRTDRSKVYLTLRNIIYKNIYRKIWNIKRRYSEVNRKILFNEIIPILWNMKDIVVPGRSFEMLHQY